MSAKRAVLAGCGWVAGIWLEALRRRDDVDVVAFVDPVESAARDRAALWGSGAVYATCSEAVADTRADLVLNLTPSEAHAAVTLQALADGCDVLVEKPLAPSVAEAARIVHAAARAGRRVSVMQNRRHEPGFRALVESVRADPGEPALMSVAVLNDWRFGGFREEIASPLLCDMAIHGFDQARCLAGSPPEWAHCHEFAIGASWLAGDATVLATFGFANGTVLDYRATWTAWGQETSWNGSWRVISAGRSITWDGEREPLVVWPAVAADGRPREDSAKERSLPLATTATGHEAGIDEMLGALWRGEASETDASDNILSVAMVEAAGRSAREGRRVQLAEVVPA